MRNEKKMEKFKTTTVKYTKFIRIDPETWAKIKNEATIRSLTTHKPCNAGEIVRELVRDYIHKIRK